MGNILGSNPTVSTINPGTHSTLDATQQQIQSQLQQFLQSGNFTNNYVGNGGQLAAGLTPAQSTTIGDFSGVTGAANANAVAGQGGVSSAISTLEGINNSSPANFSQYYQDSVVQPLEQTFNQQTLPSIERAFAGGGGTNGSDYAFGVNQAGLNLDNSIANAASSTALTEYNDNQQNKLAASSELGTLANQPLNALSTALGAQTQVQTTQQTADTLGEQYSQQGVTNNTTFANLLQQLLNTQTTASNDVVAQQGTPSALGSLLGGLGGLFSTPGGGGASAASGLLSLFSDERLKENIQDLELEVSGVPLYSYNYKGDPRRTIGTIASVLERLKPEAVSVHPSGYKMVNYLKALAA